MTGYQRLIDEAERLRKELEVPLQDTCERYMKRGFSLDESMLIVAVAYLGQSTSMLAAAMNVDGYKAFGLQKKFVQAIADASVTGAPPESSDDDDSASPAS